MKIGTEPTSAGLRAIRLAPLLRPATWSLPTGHADRPTWRFLGRVALVASAFVMWAWALASAREVWPLVVAIAWTWQLARMWAVWSQPAAMVSLRWLAPPSVGWRVEAWGDLPVQVDAVMDFQQAVLLRVFTSSGVRRQAWVWLIDDGGRDAHRLRALLRQPVCPPEAGVA